MKGTVTIHSWRIYDVYMHVHGSIDLDDTKDNMFSRSIDLHTCVSMCVRSCMILLLIIIIILKQPKTIKETLAVHMRRDDMSRTYA